jgi:16S rRNA (adenine1518-N6/adenine1519-N6)-dimethyltransferase
VKGADPIASLPPLREVIKNAQLSARKSLGQNFILDLNVTRRIAKAAGPLRDIGLIEIGPGPGGLSRALLLEGANSIVAIERDERFKPALEQIEQLSHGRFRTLFADALEVDYRTVAAESGASRLVANLPYNIATPLIAGWLTQAVWPPWFDKLVVMVQREVAERLVAAPSTPNYGRLSVLAQFRSRPRILFTLPPTVFTPPPNVSSALVEIVPSVSTLSAAGTASLERVTAAAFGQRRKMLRSSLGPLGVHTASLLREAGIDSTQRAERLTIIDFIMLARLLEERIDPAEGSPSAKASTRSKRVRPGDGA